MNKFLSPDLILESFNRLSARESDGKKHLERTSALLYFLAFDATCKHFDVEFLDFAPETSQGKNHRRQFELEFSRLVVLKNTPDSLKQVIELGKINSNGTIPEQRVSSNFFSVPVKKASNGSNPYFYPNRQKAPVFSMGKSATGVHWGVARFEQWQSNFPKLLLGAKSSTPSIDLSLFVIRDHPVRQEAEDIFSVILELLRKKFTVELCEYFSARFEEEKIFANHLNSVFSTHHKAFVDNYVEEFTEENYYKSMKKEDLIQRVIFLEGLLKKNNINI